MKNTNLLLFVILISSLFACSPSYDNEPNTPIAPIADPLTGTFVSAAHPTSGTATVNVNRTSLSFNNFSTDDGPILEVYLCTDRSNCTDFISLDILKSITGNQSYSLPGNVNFDTHSFVVIWCVDFSVSFGYAKLE